MAQHTRLLLPLHCSCMCRCNSCSSSGSNSRSSRPDHPHIDWILFSPPPLPLPHLSSPPPFSPSPSSDIQGWESKHIDTINIPSIITNNNTTIPTASSTTNSSYSSSCSVQCDWVRVITFRSAHPLPPLSASAATNEEEGDEVDARPTYVSSAAASASSPVPTDPVSATSSDHNKFATSSSVSVTSSLLRSNLAESNWYSSDSGSDEEQSGADFYGTPERKRTHPNLKRKKHGKLHPCKWAYPSD
eukprot:CAMPEP_0175151440 /NCGR_PEP_ID=MMETSP0087-20121206/18511_1 /TAXON_ID=136419 /ORGANISM="Unknown Unknown, Strain D1" /LENGTH=244 /DNA_ID=CAMNT_0016437665 /DNA_START=50 /DNA_END=781 /DNA_ORIENTATION=-